MLRKSLAEIGLWFQALSQIISQKGEEEREKRGGRRGGNGRKGEEGEEEEKGRRRKKRGDEEEFEEKGEGTVGRIIGGAEAKEKEKQ